MAKDNFGRKSQNYKGTRDYAGIDAAKRNYVIDQIKSVFELFGFEPLDTPAIELMRILDDKYGEEGQKNIFRLSSSKEDSLGGLRYDHTVPLARFMAQNPGSKILPYRRYAIGKVWRNESVQAGRYREFIQCDFDTVGSDSLVVDAEIIAMNFQVLTRLGFPKDIFTIQYNDRRLLNVMTNAIGCNETNAIEVLRAWDKLEKIGLEATIKELKEKGVSRAVIANYETLSSNLLKSQNQFQYLQQVLGSDGEDALNIITNIFYYAQSLGVPTQNVVFNPLLARGLDYYTGPIFETVIESAGIGSISGGGRFDRLIAEMGGPDLPASGSSFGLERVISVMDQLEIQFPIQVTAPVFVTIFDPTNLDLVKYSFTVAANLRLDGIPVEVYTGNQANLGKQFDIANRKGSEIVLVLGPDELSKNKITVKFLKTWEQFTIPLSALTTQILKLLS
ncbi:histidine--tRNA ligase [Candidatus Collierbacteria bacterium RIFOXYD1_FULL_40_9]|uniref:Histidine--tRNA ligase n=1 Tax=Candidatus Collierbacteria bacterium RIFOXYD1_FULL_40_9 TaxID=1817731 RepID=A0A1F5FP76_9BACT|nr:MAG: histidine--tRNA ligase [Candidatus Collierbacteria bacterium RIFOXYD1_FULL_40_9]